MRNDEDTRTAVGADQDHVERALCPRSLRFGGRPCSRGYRDHASREAANFVFLGF
jgi:hypothetical protein